MIFTKQQDQQRINEPERASFHEAVRYQVLNLFRGFIDHLYKLDIVVPGIECAMAYLLQFQAITAADIWVFTRVVEDAMLFVLVRWREQSKLETCSERLVIL